MKNLQFYILFFVCFGIFSCTDDEPVQSCRVNVVNSSITVTANVSGEEGTQITPDIIETSSITFNSAEISFTVHKVGRCHEVVDYGHVWSKEYATPTKENANQSNYGSNVNFGDEVRTLMLNLPVKSKIYVRGYVTIRSLEDYTEKTLYNNNISTFTTLVECNDGEVQLLYDNDRRIANAYDSTIQILSFEVVKEIFEGCVDNEWVGSVDHFKIQAYIKNHTSKTISCDYEIRCYYNHVSFINNFPPAWIATGSLNDLAVDAVQKVYLNDNYSYDITSSYIWIQVTNVIYK